MGMLLDLWEEDDTPHFNGLKVSSGGLSIGSKQAQWCGQSNLILCSLSTEQSGSMLGQVSKCCAYISADKLFPRRTKKWLSAKCTKFLIFMNGTWPSGAHRHSAKWYPRLFYEKNVLYIFQYGLSIMLFSRLDHVSIKSFFKSMWFPDFAIFLRFHWIFPYFLDIEKGDNHGWQTKE